MAYCTHLSRTRSWADRPRDINLGLSTPSLRPGTCSELSAFRSATSNTRCWLTGNATPTGTTRTIRIGATTNSAHSRTCLFVARAPAPAARWPEPPPTCTSRAAAPPEEIEAPATLNRVDIRILNQVLTTYTRLHDHDGVGNKGIGSKPDGEVCPNSCERH